MRRRASVLQSRSGHRQYADIADPTPLSGRLPNWSFIPSQLTVDLAVIRAVDLLETWGMLVLNYIAHIIVVLDLVVSLVGCVHDRSFMSLIAPWGRYGILTWQYAIMLLRSLSIVCNAAIMLTRFPWPRVKICGDLLILIGLIGLLFAPGITMLMMSAVSRLL